MQFIAELVRDYFFAYRVTVNNYRSLPVHFVAASLFMGGVTTLYTAVPYLLREATNALSAEQAHGYSAMALVLAGAYGATWAAAHALDWVKNLVSASVLARCDAAFHRAMYLRLIRAEYARLIEQDPGTLVSVSARSKGAFSAITFTLFWVIVPTVLQLFLSGCVLWKLTSGSFATAFVVSMFFLFIATWKLASLSRGAHAEIFGADDALSSHLVEKLSFALDIKVNDAYAREDASLRKLLRSYVEKVSRGNAHLSRLLALQAVCAGILLTAFTAATAGGVLSGVFRVGDFVMIVSYVVALTTPFTVLAGSLSDLRRNHLALREGFAILDLPSERNTIKESVRPEGTTVYEFLNVDFAIDGRRILRGSTLQICRGEVVALTGPSGAGKSTLVRLMLGLLLPDSGSIQLYGSDMTNLSTGDICRQVAVAPQSPLILSGTLRANLTYGCAEPPADSFLLELVDLLELQDLSPRGPDFILDMSLGIQGRSLSGGERQRIALGRALARRPSVVIFDEPTSSLDSEREARIFERIRRRVATVIVVTHHQTLLAQADRVYRLADGEIENLTLGRDSRDVA
jgi:ATP-binding cassette subfamily B protein